MNKKLSFAVALLFSISIYSQVGINTQDPKATLDIAARTTDGSRSEGIIAPRLTGDQIKAADALYGSTQKGTLIYATSGVTAVVSGSKTANVTAEGYYYFDGSFWQKIINTASAVALEPWYNTATNSGATSNTQDIYQLGRVGIGTSTPVTNLQVTSTSNYASLMLGNNSSGNNHHLTHETDGSFSIWDGVFGSGTKRLVVSNTGNIGIGTGNPATKLEVNNGSTAGAIKIVDGTEGTGKVLTSDANGVATWKQSFAITPTVLGSIPSAVVNNLSTNKYVGSSITLPAGKWLIYLNVQVNDVSSIPSGQYAWIRYTISSSNNSGNGYTHTGLNFLQSSVVSANLTYTGNYWPCQGVLPVEVTTGGTFYIWTVDCLGATSGLSVGNNPENYIFAIPIL